jgi:hypothetical protein
MSRLIRASRCVVAFCFLIPALACSGSSTSATSPTTVGNTPITTTHGSMSALIDGTSWTAVAITTASYTNGIVAIGGADSANPIRSIGFSTITSTAGTYSVSTAASNAVLSIGIGPTWTANIAGGSGSVVITSLSSTAAVGTFSFSTVAAVGGATGTHAITQGVFNITF